MIGILIAVLVAALVWAFASRSAFPQSWGSLLRFSCCSPAFQAAATAWEAGSAGTGSISPRTLKLR